MISSYLLPDRPGQTCQTGENKYIVWIRQKETISIISLYIFNQSRYPSWVSELFSLLVNSLKIIQLTTHLNLCHQLYKVNAKMGSASVELGKEQEGKGRKNEYVIWSIPLTPPWWGALDGFSFSISKIS